MHGIHSVDPVKSNGGMRSTIYAALTAHGRREFFKNFCQAEAQ